MIDNGKIIRDALESRKVNSMEEFVLRHDNANLTLTSNERDFIRIEFHLNYEEIIDLVNGIKNQQEFDASFQSAWSTQEDIASSKLMQLTFIHAVLKMKEKQQKEFLTNLTFLAQKKGRKFGPFGKLY